MNATKNNRKTKAWSILATVLVLGSIAGLTAAGGLDVAANFGRGSGNASADMNATDVDARLRSDVTETLQANAAVQADLTDALETATRIQAEGNELLDSVTQMSADARGEVEAPAQSIVSQSNLTRAKLSSQLDATRVAAVKLETAVESNVRDNVEDALEQMIATHAQAEEDLRATASTVDEIKEEAESIEASAQFSTDLRGVAPTQADAQASAKDIVGLSTELDSQVQDALDSITSAQLGANATLDANLVSVGMVDGSVNGTGKEIAGQVAAGGPK